MTGTPQTERDPTARPGSVGTSWRAHALWGGTGFALGVAVWHFVGFWSFMTTLVVRGPEPRAAATTRPLAEPVDALAAARASAAACSALVLDRASGTTRLAVCPEDGGAAQAAAREAGPRADRLLATAGRKAGGAITAEARVSAGE